MVLIIHHVLEHCWAMALSQQTPVELLTAPSACPGLGLQSSRDTAPAQTCAKPVIPSDMHLHSAVFIAGLCLGNWDGAALEVLLKGDVGNLMSGCSGHSVG